MPQIVYRGHTPVVSVPAFRLADVQAGVPIDVPTHVAENLTAGGTGPWVLLGVDDETPED